MRFYCLYNFILKGLFFPEFSRRTQWTIVNIKNDTGRVQTGVYRSRFQHVIALNINLIRRDDRLTVSNGMNKESRVEGITICEKLVTLDVSS